MILVVGQYPDESNHRDGMVQRIAAVDGMLAAHERVYVTLVHEPFRDLGGEVVQVAPRTRRVQLNWFEEAHVALLSKLATEASCVLVHSLHWAQHVMPLYRARPVVTDLHGVVPEEHAFSGDTEAAHHFERVEAFVMRHGALHLSVSEAMAAHVRAKHPGLTGELLTLPVTTGEAPADLEVKARGPLRLVYSGGLQPWQNVDRMLEVLARAPVSLPVELLTPEVGAVQAKVARAGLGGRVAVRSVPPEQMPQALSGAHLGFILRDEGLVNRVACPTKLQEYLAHGVVPIVLSREIGDFAALGYRTVGLDALEAGALPSLSEWRQMAGENQRVFAALREAALDGAARLGRYVAAPPPSARERVEEELVPARLMAARMTPPRARTKRVPLRLLRRLLP